MVTYKSKRYSTVFQALEYDNNSAVESIKGVVLYDDNEKEIGKTHWFKKSAFKKVKLC